jgi:hypothetical protein
MLSSTRFCARDTATSDQVPRSSVHYLVTKLGGFDSSTDWNHHQLLVVPDTITGHLLRSRCISSFFRAGTVRSFFEPQTAKQQTRERTMLPQGCKLRLL